MDDKDYTKWTRAEFEALPERKWDQAIVCDAIILLPMKTRHDSGYRHIDAVAIVDGKPTCRLSGCSDVVHIDGIGGFGNWSGGPIPDMIPAKDWTMDCLPVSGLFCLWSGHHGYQIKVGPALSSLEIFGVKRPKQTREE